jgi:hypothetical protein
MAEWKLIGGNCKSFKKEAIILSSLPYIIIQWSKLSQIEEQTNIYV